jgi:hypothetical protein
MFEVAVASRLKANIKSICINDDLFKRIPLPIIKKSKAILQNDDFYPHAKVILATINNGSLKTQLLKKIETIEREQHKKGNHSENLVECTRTLKEYIEKSDLKTHRFIAQKLDQHYKIGSNGLLFDNLVLSSNTKEVEPIILPKNIMENINDFLGQNALLRVVSRFNNFLPQNVALDNKKPQNRRTIER